ncbi:hypothetical protein WJX82_010988 [Trebouxia sp. C0006]
MVPSNKIVKLDEFSMKDDLSHVQVVEAPVPELKQGEVLVNAYLRPVNPTDVILIRTGWGGLVPLPSTPGSEGVGKVVKNGPGASKFKEGQRVAAAPWPQFQGRGSWAQYVAVPEKDLILVPESLTDQTAAQIFINPMTVYGMLREQNIPKGEFLLQTAATSVLGRQMISLAKHYGVQTINVVRRKEAVDELKSIGAEHVINSETEDIQKRVKEITGGKMAYGAIDAIGGKMSPKVVASIRKSGTYMLYGALDPSSVSASNSDLLANTKVLTGFLIYDWIEKPHKQEVIKEVLSLLEKKILEPNSGRSYKFEEVKEAINECNRAGRGAKVFLEG